MPSLNVRIARDTAAVDIERVLPDARKALKRELRTLADEIGADARDRARAHIHYRGAKRPGSYVESIRGGVADKRGALLGYVRSGHPLAHLLELGTKPHDIGPDKAKALHFNGSAGEVFASLVHDPGMQPYPAIYPAFAARRGDIADALAAAVQEAVHR